jgi:hypothetical protein
MRVGKEHRVTLLPLDASHAGEIVLPFPQDLNQLVMAALAPKRSSQLPTP